MYRYLERSGIYRKSQVVSKSLALIRVYSSRKVIIAGQSSIDKKNWSLISIRYLFSSRNPILLEPRRSVSNNELK